MNSSTKFLATICILTAAIFGFYSVKNKLHVGSESPNPVPIKTVPGVQIKNKTYTNSNYKFSFEYPGYLELQEYGKDASVIGRRSTLQFTPLVDVSVIKSGTEIGLQSFDEFVLDEARIACSSRSATIVFTCTRIDDIVKIKPFTSTNKIQGQVFYLKAEEKNITTGKTTNKRRGPFYTFNTSANTPGVMSFVMINNPTTLDADKADLTSIEVVAKSFILRK